MLFSALFMRDVSEKSTSNMKMVNMGGQLPCLPSLPPFSYGSVIPESNNETKKKKKILIDIGEAEDKEYTRS